MQLISHFIKKWRKFFINNIDGSEAGTSFGSSIIGFCLQAPLNPIPDPKQWCSHNSSHDISHWHSLLDISIYLIVYLSIYQQIHLYTSFFLSIYQDNYISIFLSVDRSFTVVLLILNPISELDYYLSIYLYFPLFLSIYLYVYLTQRKLSYRVVVEKNQKGSKIATRSRPDVILYVDPVSQRTNL